MGKFKTVLNYAVSELIPNKTKKVALLMSGGIDSFTLAVTLTDLGIPVQAYTFRVDGYTGKDVQVSERNATILGIDWKVVDITSETLEKDFIELATVWKCKKKTEFECTWPFTKLFPHITEDTVVSGVTADTLYGDGRKIAINYSKPKSVFDSYRRKCLSKQNIEGHRQIIMLANTYGKQIVIPFLHEAVQEYFMSLDFFQIHRPGQKGIAKIEFAEDFAKIDKKINSKNLQIDSNISTIFERLLSSPLNTKKRNRIMDLCRDYVVNEE